MPKSAPIHRAPAASAVMSEGMIAALWSENTHAALIFKGEIIGLEPLIDDSAGIIAVLIGLVQRDGDDGRSLGIITTNEHASSTLMAGVNAAGGWDPTSVASPRDAASGYVEAEWLDF